jgi:hypothetical protein
MPPQEFWWLVTAKMPPEVITREDDMATLYNMLKDAN